MREAEALPAESGESWVCAFTNTGGGMPPAGRDMVRLPGQHPPVPFNPDGTNALAGVGQLRPWGRRIKRTVQVCGAAGAPAPPLQHEESRLWVKFAFPTSPDLGGDLRGTPEVAPEVALLRVMTGELSTLNIRPSRT
ncbi:hypothetical protein GCM10008939_23210 [Deinococcus aquiradiocola]|uniref:Uncharacterized protein n=1 Tax=Deinococcus aquiradiocola TaxID=393059 RepID=A0A917UR48_9DEIO|nr:hypothetical protein GCM10008939_23210 [Deinococcus aquiradiocola]